MAVRYVGKPCGENCLEIEADMTLADALEREARQQAPCMRDADFREAYDAFVNKRQPRFGQ